MRQTPSAVTNEALILIAVPWAYGTPDTPARVSAFVSPRLSAAGSGLSVLASASVPGGLPHCAFAEWTRTIEAIEFEVQLKGRGTIAKKVFQGLDHDLWDCLFPRSTIVRDFVEANITAQADVPVVMSYSPKAALDAVRDIYMASGISAALPVGEVRAQTADDNQPFRKLFDFHFGRGNRPQNVPDTPIDSRTIVEHALPIAPSDADRLFVADVRIDEQTVIVPCYLLPHVPSDSGFQVIIRSTLDYGVNVDAPDGEKIGGTATFRVAPGPSEVVFERTPDGWRARQRLDLHEAVSSLSSYPHLLRRLGLLLDFELPMTLGALPSVGELAITTGHNVACTIDSRFVSPWTAYQVEATRGELLLSAPPARVPLTGAQLNLSDRDRFHLVQLDLDGAAMKLATAAAEAEERAARAPVTPAIAALAQDVPMTPALRQAGFSLVDEDAQTLVEAAVDAVHDREDKLAALLQDPAAPIPTLTGDDLLTGFRIDVSRDGGRWRSLCQRIGSYSVDGSCDIPDEIDEGFIDTVADRDDTGALRISRALFRWDGWSLAAPRPSKGIDAKGNVSSSASNDTPGASVPLRVRFAAKGGSLERLRFGSKYEFRARAVDIAGNSLTTAQADEIRATGTVLGSSTPFTRFEPVDAPVLVPLQPTGAGEASDVLVIRERRHAGIPEIRRWAVLPPRVAQSFCEMHGVFDGMEANAAWNLVTGKEGDLPGGSRDAVFDAEWIGRYVSPKGEITVPYLPDPLSRGATFTIRRGGVRGASLFAKERPQPLRADHVSGFQLVVEEGALNARSLGNAVVLSVPAGRTVEVDLTSSILATDRERFGLWHWLVERDPNLCTAGGTAETCAGAVRHLTPAKTIRVVNAVRRPLLADTASDQAVLRLDPVPSRSEGDTIITVKGELVIDTPSTGRVDIHASWTDRVHDRSLPQFSSRTLGARPFEEFVPPDGGPHETRLVLDGEHALNDTKHHWIDYHAIGTSRFIDFFAGSATSPDEFARKSTVFRVNVLATKAPAQPEPFYVVPTFAGEKQYAGRTFSAVRRGGGLRIYLRGEWFSSGNDEVLAVVTAPPGDVPSALATRITEWGADPVWRTSELSRRPLTDDFLVPDERRVRGAEIRIAAERRAALNARVQTTVTTERVDLALYEVQIDADKKLLYADIDVAVPAGTYFPFIKLALARYQPHAIPQQKLSPIIRAAFIQVAPDRSLTVTREAAHAYGVRFAGPTYDPIARPNLTTGLRSTVEVSVERKSSGLGGSQMDWFPAVDYPPVVLQPPANDLHSREGRIVLDRNACCDHRLVVREYEHFLADGPNGTADSIDVRRLVYVQTVEVGEI